MKTIVILLSIIPVSAFAHHEQSDFSMLQSILIIFGITFLVRVVIGAPPLLNKIKHMARVALNGYRHK